ncbi:hypothetical protein NQ315_004253 [Exocentrus adspersus]|uniref:C2H2-type domain-containing protein n=1 Tax=Exocentrus adspersus TaxID=1586481 RepID=A0AAV8W826_9CUCU|nr:hypothetical protein NQ315_004253 [Exocentrus adspersus]
MERCILKFRSLYHDQLYSTQFTLDSLNPANLHMQCKYLMDVVDYQKQTIPDDNILGNSVVDQLNESDTELLNLLTAEEDCTAILNNIATNEQFQRLISNEADFVQTEEMEEFMSNNCELPPASVNIEEKTTKEGFKCDQCQRICATKKLLKKHLLIHTQERTFPCETCGKLFRHKYEVTAHQRSHNKPTFQCDICSRMFIHKSHLNVHRKKHLGEYTAFCEECQIGFVTLTSFKTHRNVYHDNLQLICDNCGAALSSLSSLKEHKLTHDPNYGKERSHVCDICGKSYLTSRNLRCHMKIHSKICAYKCNICGKSVSSKSILETHQKMHTGEFTTKSHLMTHYKTHDIGGVDIEYISRSLPTDLNL